MFNAEGTRFFLEVIEAEFGGLEGLRGKRMLELGNQYMWEHVWPTVLKGKRYYVAKAWFESLGVDHVSIDRNGKDGALPFTLARPIPECLGLFDVATNEGTMEHVDSIPGQYECLANVHRMMKVGGVMIHALPPAEGHGQWDGTDEATFHCRVHYKDNFIPTLALLNGYEVLAHERTVLTTLGGHVDYIQAALRKTKDAPFTPEREELLKTIEWRP